MNLLILLVFGSTVALVLGVASLVGQRPAKRRLARLADGSVAPVPHTLSEDSVLAQSRPSRFARLLGSLGRPGKEKETQAAGRLRQRLIQAGYRNEGAVGVFLGSRIVLALLAPSLLLATAFATLESWRLVPLLFAATGLGYVLPSWWVDRRKSWRQGQVERGLPDALDLMVVCVEAGFGVNASLQRVAKEFAPTNPVLSAEMELVTLEIRAGKSTVDALRGLAERTGVSEVSSLVALLVQTNRFGTSVADALRVHADSMRVRRMQKAEEKAGQAPLKMIFPTVVIFLATMIVLLTPAVIQFNGMFEKK